MLFNMALVFAVMFLLNFLLIKVKLEEQKAVPLKAEFIVTLTWPDESLDDIDLWIQLPDKRVVNFKSKDVDYVTLDRDDRGGHGDTYYDGQGTRHLIKLNKEVITIRALVPGRYTVNVHAYNFFKTVGEFTSTVQAPYPIKVTLTKINPSVIDVVTATVSVLHVGDQKTAFTFEINEAGNAINVDTQADVPFIQALGNLIGGGTSSQDFSPGDRQGGVPPNM